MYACGGRDEVEWMDTRRNFYNTFCTMNSFETKCLCDREGGGVKVQGIVYFA